MTARHHHYLSQCYLKGFTEGGSKNSKLVVFDLLKKKKFETIPRNVGGVRDFNRVDVEGLDQNVLEKSLANFEGHAATALRKIDSGSPFEGEDKELILNLVAMLATRSPERREHWRQFQAKVIDKVMSLSLETKERWESQTKNLPEGQTELSKDISYEDMKQFIDSKQYRIDLAREHHIEMEFVGIDAILPCLLNRDWLVIKSSEITGPFISSDNPVILTWNEPDKQPPFYRNSPGFGMGETQVYFPVSKNTALVGEFGGRSEVISANPELVAIFNSQIIHHTYKQLYSPKSNFLFLGSDNKILDGRYLLNQFKA